MCVTTNFTNSKNKLGETHNCCEFVLTHRVITKPLVCTFDEWLMTFSHHPARYRIIHSMLILQINLENLYQTQRQDFYTYWSITLLNFSTIFPGVISKAAFTIIITINKTCYQSVSVNSKLNNHKLAGPVSSTFLDIIYIFQQISRYY